MLPGHKENKALLHATRGMDLRRIMLSDQRSTWKNHIDNMKCEELVSPKRHKVDW